MCIIIAWQVLTDNGHGFCGFFNRHNMPFRRNGKRHFYYHLFSVLISAFNWSHEVGDAYENALTSVAISPTQHSWKPGLVMVSCLKIVIATECVSACRLEQEYHRQNMLMLMELAVIDILPRTTTNSYNYFELLCYCNSRMS